jgi:hypothetical protein
MISLIDRRRRLPLQVVVAAAGGRDEPGGDDAGRGHERGEIVEEGESGAGDAVSRDVVAVRMMACPLERSGTASCLTPARISSRGRSPSVAATWAFT